MSDLTMKPVYSSHIREVGYDVAQRELVVVYKTGRRSVYSCVDPEKAASVVNAPSVGEALHRLVKALPSAHPHQYRG